MYITKYNKYILAFLVNFAANIFLLFQLYAILPLIIWMAIDAAVPQPDYDPNPMGLLISEIHTSASSVTMGVQFPDFLEVYSKSKLIGQPMSLKNYYVAVAERSGVRSDTLQVTQLIDLGKSTLGQYTKYGIISTANGGTDSLVAPFPNGQWRTFVQTDIDNWLSVKDKKFLTIYLLYSETKIIPDIIPPGRKQLIKGELLETLHKHVVDYVTIKKHNGPSTCKLVDEVVKNKRMSKAISILDLFLEEHTRVNVQYYYSVSRCASDSAFDLRSFKHSEPTPHLDNDCSGRVY